MIGVLIARLLPLVPRAVVRGIAARYVAGENLDTAVKFVRQINDESRHATLDILGEDSADRASADKTRDDYLRVIERIASEGIDSNISIKLTHLGVRNDLELAQSRLMDIVDGAEKQSNFTRIDMEDSSVTDVTLDLYRHARKRCDGVGTALQSCLRRTADDARRLSETGADIRICKGIYREPAAIAFRSRKEVRDSYIETAGILMGGSDTYVAFATHDRYLIRRVVDLVDHLGFPHERCEFQVLLGVPMGNTLKELQDRGFKVRVYVPYGEEWYPYATRRLKENPRIATYVLKHMLLSREGG